MTAKNRARYLMVGSLTILAGSAAARAKRTHRRARAERQATAEEGRSPGTDVGCDAPLASEPAAAVPADVNDWDWDCADLTAPVGVSASDLEYYRACWGHIRGTFAHWPAVGLDLAETLTANLMLNRGLVPGRATAGRRFPGRGAAPAGTRVRRGGAGGCGGEGRGRVTIRVVVADDQALLCAGLTGIIGTAPDLTVVGEAGDGYEAVQVARATKPDVVLMDVRMPALDGVGATRLVTSSLPDTRVLMLTTFDLDEYVYGALRAGASGFLLKDVPPAELLAAIRVVAGGEALLAPRVTRRLIERFASAPTRTRTRIRTRT